MLEVVLSFAVLAGHAIATAMAGGAPLASLTKRQTTLNPSDIPAQCKNQCAPAVNYLNTCGQSVTCLCSDSTNTAIYDCLECVVDVHPTASVMYTLQTTLTEYENNCRTAGVEVSLLTLTLPNGSSGAPTATATGASDPVTMPATTSNPSANSDPLARNDAGIIGVSVASVAVSAVGVAMAALL